LSSVTLVKAFAECFPGFAYCFIYSAKSMFPIVLTRDKKDEDGKVRVRI
jgi:hypothetical protein